MTGLSTEGKVLNNIKRLHPHLIYRYAFKHETGIRFVFRDKKYNDYEFDMFSRLVSYNMKEVLD